MSGGAAVVVDSWAILALLRRENPAGDVVRRYLRRAHRGNVRLLLNLVNLGEVYYRMMQIRGADSAEEGMRRVRNLPIEMVPVREAVVMEAARMKAAHPIAYADAFAVATTRLERARLLTGDPEIVSLPALVVRVIPLRRN